MILTDPRIPMALGWALVHFLWQGLALALLTALALRFMPRAHHRYALACLALALCVLLPTGTALQQFRSQRSPILIQHFQVLEEKHLDPLPNVTPFAPSLAARMEAAIRPHLPRIVLLWALGSLLLSMRLGIGWACTLRWRQRAEDIQGDWAQRLQQLSLRLGLRRKIRLKLSRFVDSPVTMGLWRPVILAPASLFTGMAPELIEALLAHELAHIQRHDYLVNILQSFVEIILFYHPAVWWISRRIRIEREVLADQQAAWALGEPRRLALALNALDDLQPHLNSLALSARGGHLMHRIQNLLRPLPQMHANPLRAWAAPALLTLALITPLAAAIQLRNTEPIITVPSELIQKIDALAASEDIDPDLLRAIAWNESHFNVNARSQMGAMGILQVMPETARHFGATNLEDPEQVAKAGAHYLRHLLDTYQGDLTKAVSAYNGGEPSVNSGQLSDETRAYTPMVLALYKTRAVQPDQLFASPIGLPIPDGKTSQAYGANGHPGIDQPSPEGTPVHATAEGRVTFSGTDGDRGITVIIQHGGGLETLYSHLSEARVSVGNSVLRGTIIGTTGRTGKATGSHVHYEVRLNGKPVDPTTVPTQITQAAASPQRSKATGEIKRLPDGKLQMSAHIWWSGNPVRLEIFPDDSKTSVASLIIGSKDEQEQSDGPLMESRPVMVFPDKAKKSLRIHVTGGHGRWGETIMDAQTLPGSFQFNCDREAEK